MVNTPSTKAEISITRVLLRLWAQKSIRIEPRGIRIKFWIVQHEPRKKYPHQSSLSNGKITRYSGLSKRLWVSCNHHGRYLLLHDEGHLAIYKLYKDRTVMREDYRWERRDAIASLQGRGRWCMADVLCRKSREVCPVQWRCQVRPELSALHQDGGSWLRRMHG